MRPALVALLLSVASLPGLAVAVGPAAWADDGCRGLPVTRAQALAIAASLGLVRVKKIECDDDDWEVEGWTLDGREIEMDIDARTGRIEEVEYD